MLNLSHWLGLAPKPRTHAGKRRLEDRCSVTANTDTAVRFLVITGDDCLHSRLQDIATTCKWTMFCVPTLEQAIPLLQRECIPLAIYDWNTPDSDWPDALKQLTAVQSDCCVLLASAVADEYLRHEVVRRQGYDVLPRSADGEQLMRALQFAWFWRTHSGM